MLAKMIDKIVSLKETKIARQALAAEPELRAACTACALRGGRSGRRKRDQPAAHAISCG